MVVGTTWPLVGRDEEVEFLARALDAGDSSGCVLSGRAGVGKTRLAMEVAARARAAGCDVEWLTATHTTNQIVLGAFAPVLGEPPPLASEGELLHWARRSIAARAGLVLCVDDAHLLDDASASILLQLAARREAFLVATIRSREPCPEDLVSLWKDGWVERVEVLPLGRNETGALARDLLGTELTPSTRERLFELSRGVPLYLRELMLASVEEGSIVDTDDGRKHWLGRTFPSDRLAELVSARLARLGDDERDAMLTIALGEPVEVRTVERVVARPVLSKIEQRGLVNTEPVADRPVVRTAHPLYGDVLRENVPPAQWRELHSRLADAADEVGCDDDDLRVAAWRLESGEPGDPERLLRAGTRALRTFDTALAERLGRAAADQGGGPQANVLVADALYYANRWEEAAGVLAALPAGDLDDDTRAEATTLRASLLIWSAGNPEAAHDLLTEAAAEIADPVRRAEVDSQRVWPLVVSDRVEDATVIAARYMSETSPHRHATVRALPAAVLANAIRGQTGEALAVAERGAQPAADMGEVAPTLLGELLAATCFALWLDGRLLEGEGLAQDAFASGYEDWSDGGRGLFGFIQAKAALERGHADRALTLIEDAVVALRRDDIGGFLPWAYFVQARAAALRGDVERARLALAAGDEQRLPSVRLAEPDRTFALAAAREATEPGAGRELLTGASRDFESWGALPYALLALTDAVRLGQCEGTDAARASELASSCQGTLAPALAAFVRGATVRDASGLRACANELESAGVDLLAAEAVLLAAQILHHDGRRGAELGARCHAAELLGRCGSVQTPIVASSAPSPLDQLTQREREVAHLVGSGLTNREVAEKLHVSERTVDNHVQNAFAKLGIHERGDLRALA